MDLVELTGTREASAPQTRLMAIVSNRSLSWVLVPWALMHPTSAGCIPASLSAFRIARAAPSPSGSGWVMWKASALVP